MAKVRKIPKVIEVHQLVEGELWPTGVRWNQLSAQKYVTTIQGVDVPVEYGEWIMPEGDGVHFYPCADSVLRATHEFVEDGAGNGS